jgi:hypothetical protein
MRDRISMFDYELLQDNLVEYFGNSIDCETALAQGGLDINENRIEILKNAQRGWDAIEEESEELDAFIEELMSDLVEAK